MRLKEIKPGMAIHCNDKNEKKVLFEELKKLGYVWCGKTEINADYDCEICNNTIHVYSGERDFPYKNITHGNGRGNIEFSDLIIPEMSAEEVINILHEICSEHEFLCEEKCILTNCCPFTDAGKKEFNSQEVYTICEQWKAKHEKKEPEFEWVWQGRIYEVHDPKKGNFYQLKDGNGFYDTGCLNKESAEEYMAEVLKDYCKDHEGEFIAVVTRVCRVKNDQSGN